MRKSIFLILVLAQMTGCAKWTGLSPLTKLENRFLYHPSPFPDDFPDESVPFENVEFSSADGTRLHGWFADHPEPLGIALICHGNAGNIVALGDSLSILNKRHRLAAMVFDYRGYGRSEGVPSEEGILADARAARTWLANRKRVDESEIILMGRSLGGAVAIDLAAKDGARALVVASTFSSLPNVAKHHVRYAPVSWLMRQRFDSIEKIANYHGPFLQSHGDADTLIPIELARELFDAAPGDKRFVTILNAGHNDPQTEEYREALDRFLVDLNRDMLAISDK